MRKRQQKELHYGSLVQAATLRAHLYERAREFNNADLQLLSAEYARQLLLEIKVVPLRWRMAIDGYDLRFDQIILDADSDPRDYVESRFFRLLWEHSQAVPRTALALWLRSLRYDGGRVLRVTLPETGLDEAIAKTSANTPFALAAVVRHENLTSAEALETDLALRCSKAFNAAGLAWVH